MEYTNSRTRLRFMESIPHERHIDVINALPDCELALGSLFVAAATHSCQLLRWPCVFVHFRIACWFDRHFRSMILTCFLLGDPVTSLLIGVSGHQVIFGRRGTGWGVRCLHVCVCVCVCVSVCVCLCTPVSLNYRADFNQTYPNGFPNGLVVRICDLAHYHI